MTGKKHKENLDENKLKLASFVTFLMGISQAVLTYVVSSYFNIATGLEGVGIFYGISYAIFLIILLNLHKTVRLLGKANVFYFALLGNIILSTFLVFIKPSAVGALLVVIYLILSSIQWVMLDIIVESFSTDKMSGRIRGLHLTIFNLGFLFGPFVSTYIVEKSGFNGVFLSALVLNCFVFVFALMGFRGINHKFEQRLKVSQMISKVFKKKDILRIYYISFVLEFFYALMVIYTPIYLRDLGYTWESIGLIFTIMLAPFVLVQYPMGILADKRTGEKEFLVFAIVIMAISTVSIYFISTGSVLIWASILFTTRIGAALVEILRDSYFFKRVDAYDVDIINFFRTSLPMAYIIATMVASFMLFFLPIKFSFIFTGMIVLSALYPAIKLVDNKSEKEIA